uniref:Uncharacterized protein n=1 Tax=Arundo donax TaxID=35708 RepID=A0A0A9ABV4_ARUDO
MFQSAPWNYPFQFLRTIQV